MKDVDVITGKAKYFLESNTKVHVSMNKGSQDFYNGFIREVKADFIMFEDRVLGLLPVFYSQIEDIEPFKEVKE